MGVIANVVTDLGNNVTFSAVCKVTNGAKCPLDLAKKADWSNMLVGNALDNFDLSSKTCPIVNECVNAVEGNA